MKRNIQFKAKRLSDKEWVHGYYIQYPRIDGTIRYCIGANDISGVNYYDIDSSTLCEYTGMKDSKDKEIYEGDIVRFIDERGNIYLAKIVYENAQFKCIWEDKVNYLIQDLSYWVKNEWIEVIDSIHDCPDFIEGSWSK
jgi:uncharacterized phage protein (TIGR01671 family)